jgi:AraC-like DNA-binding protein
VDIDERSAERRLPTYSEMAPAQALRSWIECYWHLRGAHDQSVRNRILPDGCTDLIVNLSRSDAPFIVGPMPTAEVIEVASEVDLFGVRFRPGGAHRFLATPLHELLGSRVTASDLGIDGDALADELWHTDGRQRVAVVDRFLFARLRRVRPSALRDEALTVRAVAHFRATRGGASVSAVAAALGVGTRRLERAFDGNVGLRPKALARVLRFRQLVAMMGRVERPNWATIALQAGYADQAHMIREFRTLSGVTPSQYHEERRRVGFVQYTLSDER